MLIGGHSIFYLVWITGYPRLTLYSVVKGNAVQCIHVMRGSAVNVLRGNTVQCSDTLTRGCIKVHGGVPIVLCFFGDPL